MFLASSALDLALLLVMLIDFIFRHKQNSTVVSIFLNSSNDSENITTLYLLAYLEIQPSVISMPLYVANSIILYPVTTNTKYVYDVE